MIAAAGLFGSALFRQVFALASGCQLPERIPLKSA